MSLPGNSLQKFLADAGERGQGRPKPADRNVSHTEYRIRQDAELHFIVVDDDDFIEVAQPFFGQVEKFLDVDDREYPPPHIHQPEHKRWDSGKGSIVLQRVDLADKMRFNTVMLVCQKEFHYFNRGFLRLLCFLMRQDLRPSLQYALALLRARRISAFNRRAHRVYPAVNFVPVYPPIAHSFTSALQGPASH